MQEAIKNLLLPRVEGILERMPELRRYLVRRSLHIDPKQRYSQLETRAAGIAAVPGRGKRIFVDISRIRQLDVKTGIQRTVRAWLQALLEIPVESHRVEPVYLNQEHGRWVCRHARNYLASLTGSLDRADEEIIEPATGDIFLALDLTNRILIEAEWVGLFKTLQNRGVRTYAVVYDLLPVLMPEMFAPGADIMHDHWLRAISRLDGAICISETVAHELAQWRQREGFNDSEEGQAYRIAWAHLGNDILNSIPSMGMSPDAQMTLQSMHDRISYLMVGMLEPRKAYGQVLDAFEQLWKDNQPVNLIIVGKAGWMAKLLVSRLENHKEKSKRLFWLPNASDEYLEKIYGASTCLIAASYGEGFGLPLIEASRHRLPIIARDLPVFREVAGDYAYYFEAKDGKDVAAAIAGWLVLREKGEVPRSESMPLLTWKQSAEGLMDLLIPAATHTN